MKVCLLSLNIASYFAPTPRSKYGGAEVQAGFVARALKDQGVDVSLVTANLLENECLPYPAENAFQNDAGLPVLRFFHPRMTGIFAALDRADADVYYQRNAGMVTGLVADFARRNGRAFIYGAGSDTDFSFRKVLIDGWRDRAIYMYGLRRAHGVVVQNDVQRRAAEQCVRKTPVLTILGPQYVRFLEKVTRRGPEPGAEPALRPNTAVNANFQPAED